MNGCEDKRLLLNALIDDELDAANTIALEQHLKTCPACARALGELRSVREMLAAPGVAYAAPEAFRRRLRIALAAQANAAGRTGSASRPQRRAWSWPAWTSAAAGAAAATVLGLTFVSFQGVSTPVADELVADHVRSMLGDHLTDVATSNKHVVKPWFDGKVAFAPTVVDFADQGFPLVGGRLEYVDGQRAAALVYRRGLHVINVFVWPAQGPERLLPARSRQGYNLVHWRAGGLEYWAVSDVDIHDLRKLRDLFQAAQTSA
jgi:anti-sigma factor RsiW